MQVGVSKITILDEYLAIGSTTAAVRSTVAAVHRAVYRTDRHASVNLVYHCIQYGRPRRREEKRTVRCGNSETEVTNNRRLRSSYYIEASY